MTTPHRKRRPLTKDDPQDVYTITQRCTTGQHAGCPGRSLNRLCICDCHNADEIANAQPNPTEAPTEDPNAST